MIEGGVFMDQIPNCPKCESTYTYSDGTAFICPECAHEWTAFEQKEAEEAALIRDSVGNILEPGDSVTIIKDLKVKGATSDLKAGTKVKNIKFCGDVDGHDLEAKVEGFGSLYIRSQYVKKLF
jgi:protein PhnA